MDELKKAYKIAKMIGVAMLISVFIFGAVTELLKDALSKKAGVPFEGYAPGAPFLDTLKFVLFLFAIAHLFLIRFMKKSIVKPRESDTAGEQDISILIRKLQSSALVSYALAEAIVIYGFVIFLIGGSSADFFPFFIISLGAFLIYFPRFSQWEELAKAQGYKFGQTG